MNGISIKNDLITVEHLSAQQHSQIDNPQGKKINQIQ